MFNLKKARTTAPGFSDLLPYAAGVDDGIILNKDGSLLAAWCYQGPDLESSTRQELSLLSARLNAVLLRLGTGAVLHIDSYRTRSTDYPARERSYFPDPITKAIDEERREAFTRHGNHFESTHFITLTYMPPGENQTRLARWMYADDESAKQTYANMALAEFKTKLADFEDQINNFIQVRRLRTERYQDEHGSEHYRDYLLQHLNCCITGDNQPINLPPVPMYLDAMLSRRFIAGITPVVDDQRLGIIALEGFPSFSEPAILHELDTYPIKYRWSTRFIALDALDAQKQLDAARRKWSGKAKKLMDQVTGNEKAVIDQDAVDMSEDAKEALSEASSNLVSYGYYTSVIVLYDTDQQRLDFTSRKIVRALGNLGFVARTETLNAAEAYIGSLPGSVIANVRRPLIHSLNLTHLLPINDVYAGLHHNPNPFYPPKSPPLMQVATSGSTPLRLNIHAGDVGHTQIIGPTGSGKSTLLALLAAQFQRYKGAQTFIFDKGNSILPLTLAIGGHHYEIGEDGSELAFCPLANIDTAAEQSWAQEWIETVVALNKTVVTIDYRNEIARAIGLMAEGNRRTITDFVNTIQVKEIRAALQPYTIEAANGQLFDALEDKLVMGDFQTFELDRLMSMGEDKVLPVLLYLFNRIERRLTGRPSLIILDEAWIFLGHELFRNKIVEWLRTLRRANCAVVFATQSVADAMKSGIIEILAESCPTKIFLPNEGIMSNAKVREQYDQLGLNDRQIEIIATAQRKREYYIVTPDGRRLFDMELGPLTLAFVGASSKEELTRVKYLHQTYGADWPRQWLKERNVSDALIAS
jgi:type IV secretion system protein TrbE